MSKRDFLFLSLSTILFLHKEHISNKAKIAVFLHVRYYAGCCREGKEGSRKNKYWFWTSRSLQSGLSKYNFKFEAGRKGLY